MISEIIKKSETKECYYHSKSYPGWMFFGLQFWLPNVKFKTVKEVKDINNIEHLLGNEKHFPRLESKGFVKKTFILGLI